MSESAKEENLFFIFENSSNVARAEYDPFMKVLSLTFKSSGHVYDFLNVEKEMYAELIKAPSAGSFFSKEIKNKYTVFKRAI